MVGFSSSLCNSLPKGSYPINPVPSLPLEINGSETAWYVAVLSSKAIHRCVLGIKLRVFHGMWTGKSWLVGQNGMIMGCFFEVMVMTCYDFRWVKHIFNIHVMAFSNGDWGYFLGTISCSFFSTTFVRPSFHWTLWQRGSTARCKYVLPVCPSHTETVVNHNCHNISVTWRVGPAIGIPQKNLGKLEYFTSTWIVRPWLGIISPQKNHG